MMVCVCVCVCVCVLACMCHSMCTVCVIRKGPGIIVDELLTAKVYKLNTKIIVANKHKI